MSIFRLKTECAVCHGVAGLTRQRIANKQWVCRPCYRKTNLTYKHLVDKPLRKYTVEDIQAAIDAADRNMDELKAFHPTKKIGSLVEFDDTQKKWLILSPILGKRNKSIVYNYSDIVDFELLEDGESVSQGGLGRALVGGMLFGSTGAVVGGVTGRRKNKAVCNSLRIKVTMNNLHNPTVYINVIQSRTKKSGFVYKQALKEAQEIMSVLQLICNEQTEQMNQPAASVADEIRKYKELLDEGILTEEEFNTKKNELLRS